MSRKIDSLPQRPLTTREANIIANSDLGDHRAIAPVSTLVPPDGTEPVVAILAYANEETDTNRIVGYSPESENWEVIESWSSEEWSVEKQEDAIGKWAEENYEGVEHGFVNVDEL